MTRVFDYQTDVISVIEEAQFRCRRVRVYRVEEGGTINMRVALTSDQGVELDLTPANAYALLEGLGLRPTALAKSDRRRCARGSPIRQYAGVPKSMASRVISSGSISSATADADDIFPAGMGLASIRTRRRRRARR